MDIELFRLICFYILDKLLFFIKCLINPLKTYLFVCLKIIKELTLCTDSQLQVNGCPIY